MEGKDNVIPLKTREMPGLNSLRFIAAFSVFVGHLELVKYHLGLPNSYALFERINFGGIGVYFFFVLSGFLITWLLLEERKQTGKIAVGAFYVRRILRIWPLYYLVLVLGFFLLPSIDFFELYPHGFRENFNLDLVLYLLVLPNLAFSMAPPVPHIGQAWSIGVEEQFYLLWPLFIKFTKNVGRAILVLLFLYIALKGVVWFIAGTHPSPTLQVFERYLAMSKFECMMVGGLCAWIFWKDFPKLRLLAFHPLTLLISLLAVFSLSYIVHSYHLLQDSVHLPLSLCFAVIIVNVSLNPHSFLRLNNRITNYLGTISYGFYMYHLVVLFAMVKLFSFGYIEKAWWTDLVVLVTAFLIATGISVISYLCFERYFIRLKKRFSKI